MRSSDISFALWRLCSALAPLAFCFLLAWLVTRGSISLSGGEKDIFLVLPLAVWSLVFAVASLITWAGGVALPRATRLSALVATGVFTLAFALFVVLTWQ